MARQSLIQEEDATEINLSPMIDCIFILLIFFIVTTVFVEEKGLEVNKPDAAASAALDPGQNVAFEISPDDKIHFRGREIPLAEVTSRVRESTGKSPDARVVIRAHEKASHGIFVHVWDAAKQGGASTLSFTTTN
jgi:biopolymer transport protein ExbD